MVSAVQPTGNLHVGNYLGAVKNWIDLQNKGEYKTYLFIADWHSLTGNQKAEDLKRQIIVTAAEMLALGIDPEKTVFFAQSHVPEHAELAWIFNCITPLSELYRMTQFKDKSARQEKNINVGLLDYPVLMAADILIYKGEAVPAGQDQIQHVEFTRDVGRWFNNRYEQNIFPETKHLLTEVPKVFSLLAPDKKMSKSLGRNHVLDLADEPEVLSEKLRAAVTASKGGEKAPGVLNLFLLLEKFGEKKTYSDFVRAEESGDIKYGELKEAVAQAVGGYFKTFRERRKDFLENPEKIAEILAAGAKSARMAASATLSEVQKAVGLR